MNIKIIILLTLQITPPFYVVGDKTTEALANLSNLAQKLHTWFANNKMKANHDKYDLLLSTQESFNIQIENFTIKSSKVKKL